MRKLFQQTYPTIENRLIAYFRNGLKARGYQGDRRKEAERLAQATASRAYEECTLEQCLKYGKGKGETPEEQMREGLKKLIFIKAKNELANFFKPKSKKDPPTTPLESFIAILPEETEQSDALSLEEKLRKIGAFLPPEVLKLFKKLAQGVSYEQLAKEEGTTVPALTQRIHRWRKKLRKHMSNT
jgi:hypothetical protein